MVILPVLPLIRLNLQEGITTIPTKGQGQQIMKSIIDQQQETEIQTQTQQVETIQETHLLFEIIETPAQLTTDQVELNHHLQEKDQHLQVVQAEDQTTLDHPVVAARRAQAVLALETIALQVEVEVAAEGDKLLFKRHLIS